MIASFHALVVGDNDARGVPIGWIFQAECQDLLVLFEYEDRTPILWPTCSKSLVANF